MKDTFKSVIELLEYFKDEKTCRDFLENQRWDGTVTCPHCGYDKKIYTTTRGYKCGNKECYKKFSVTVGTIFEGSKIALKYWFAAIYLGTAHKKGISSHQLSRDLGVTQKTAWFLLHRVRAMLKAGAPFMLTGMVEVDETYIGGKEKNKHGKIKLERFKRIELNHKLRQLHGKSKPDFKTPVVGAVQRDGKVILKKVDNAQANQLIPFMVENVDKSSLIITDEHRGYLSLESNGYKHDTVQHGVGEYVRGNVHTNTIEGVWSLLKRGIVGIYHQVSPKHLDRYCTEFSYRYNTRGLTDQQRFFGVLTHTQGRLTYKQLIAK